jgi:hypothetical protein
LPTISFIFNRLFGSFAGPTPAAMSAAKTKAQNLINENGVVVFSKSYCPYCKSSKDLLDKLGAKYELLELDQIGEFVPWESGFSVCVYFLCWFRERKRGNLLRFALCAGNGEGLRDFYQMPMMCTPALWMDGPCPLDFGWRMFLYVFDLVVTIC